MNTKTTTNPGAEKEKRLDLLAKANLNAGYRIGWVKDGKQGHENFVFDEFMSAVSIAQSRQNAAADFPNAIVFHVQDHTGQVVFRCQ